MILSRLDPPLQLPTLLSHDRNWTHQWFPGGALIRLSVYLYCNVHVQSPHGVLYYQRADLLQSLRSCLRQAWDVAQDRRLYQTHSCNMLRSVPQYSLQSHILASKPVPKCCVVRHGLLPKLARQLVIGLGAAFNPPSGKPCGHPVLVLR